MNDWTELRQTVGVESLIDEISRNPNVDEAHVRAETHWTWTRHVIDDDFGIRYGTSVVLSLVVSTDPGREINVARLLLSDGERRDLITHYELDEGQPYRVVSIVAKAIRE